MGSEQESFHIKLREPKGKTEDSKIVCSKRTNVTLSLGRVRFHSSGNGVSDRALSPFENVYRVLLHHRMPRNRTNSAAV